MLDLLKTQDAVQYWMVASLTSKWAVDQVIDNAVTVHLGNKVMEFIRLADGTYASPPGITTRLIKNPDQTFSLLERFGTRLNFDNFSGSKKRITQLIDIDGNTLTFTYVGDKLNTVRDAFNRTLTFQYNPDGNINTVTDSTGRSVSYGYQDGNLIIYTDPEGKIWRYGYDTSHRMTTLKNPIGALGTTTATNTYDSLGRVNTQTVPRQGGTTATYNFYFSGFRNVEEDPNGKTLTYYYDEKGREYGQENELGHKTIKEFDGQNHTVKITDPRQKITTFVYDGNHNLTEIINHLGYRTRNKYDAQFRLIDTIDPLYHGSKFWYDSEHHLISSVYGILYDQNLQPLDNGIYETGATYYPNGLTETATDGREIVTTMTYDQYGSPRTVRRGSRPSITYLYDPIGRMEGLTDQANSQTTFQYDRRSLLRKKTDPLLKETHFHYDDAGSLDYRIDRKAHRVDYTLTPTGKTERITYPTGSPVIFTYNQLDQLQTMQDGIGNTGYAYWPTGRLQSVTNPYGFAVSYDYDEAGNLKELTYPGNKKVIYEYDDLNRLKTVKIDWLNPKPTATYDYDEAGRLWRLTNFNGTVTTYGYDNANRLTSLENKKSDAGVIATYQFPILDGNGNRVRVEQNEPLEPAIPLGVTTYGYNAKKNRLLSAGAETFSYDDEGQLSTGYGVNYSFDYERRLTGIGGSYQFSYDGAGNRLQATRSGVTTRYIYDAGGNLLAEADGSNTILRYYIHGLGLLAMVTPSNQVYCYHFNAVGSTIAVTDQSQAMVNKYAYDPFGNLLNQEEAVTQPFKFVGQFGVMTEPNGFYYMRARYYDPDVGRFISEDPIGFEGGDVNLMMYVQNNPVNWVDPIGLWTFQIGISGLGGAGAGGTAGAGVVFGYSHERGFQFGSYQTVGGGGLGGASGSVTLDFTYSKNTDINQLRGVSGNTGMSGGVGLVIGGEVNIMKGAKPSYTGSIGFGGGPTAIEGHGLVTNTWIQEWTKSKNINK